MTRRALDSDQFVLSQNATYFLTFRDIGYSTNDACLLASYAEAHPSVLLEDCKLSIAKEWQSPESRAVDAMFAASRLAR
ncbi:MAG: hypothetical protein V4602_15120 [Pseudomonadota bacterium]